MKNITKIPCIYLKRYNDYFTFDQFQGFLQELSMSTIWNYHKIVHFSATSTLFIQTSHCVLNHGTLALFLPSNNEIPERTHFFDFRFLSASAVELHGPHHSYRPLFLLPVLRVQGPRERCRGPHLSLGHRLWPPDKDLPQQSVRGAHTVSTLRPLGPMRAEW